MNAAERSIYTEILRWLWLNHGPKQYRDCGSTAGVKVTDSIVFAFGSVGRVALAKTTFVLWVKSKSIHAIVFCTHNLLRMSREAGVKVLVDLMLLP